MQAVAEQQDVALLRDEVKNFLEDNFLFEFDQEITDSSDLFRSGIIDSFGYVRMLQHFEEQYQFKLSEDEYLSNIFVSLKDIVAFLETKVAKGPQ